MIVFLNGSRPPTELIVIGLILATLMAIAAPGILVVRERARQSQTTHQLKQIGLSFQNYHDSFGSFPAGPTAANSQPAPATDQPTELISPL